MSLTEIGILFLILLVVVYFLIGRKKKVKPVANKQLEDLSAGDRLEIKAFGPMNERLTVEIKSRNRHEENEGELYWFEYEGITNRGMKFWMQLESINPYEMNGGYTVISLYEFGRSAEDLLAVQENKVAFQYKGQDFYLDTAGEAVCVANNSSKGDFYEYREFINEKEDMYISLEISEGEDPQAFLSFDIDFNQVTIIS